MANIQTIRRIGAAEAAKLLAANISTTQTLLKLGGSKTGRKSLSVATGIEEDLILRWVNMADLFRIKGVAEEYAELLEAAGIETMKELASRKGDLLHQKLIEINVSQQLVRQLPTLKKVNTWVSQARDLSQKVTY
jgi:hypothetical protein